LEIIADLELSSPHSRLFRFEICSNIVQPAPEFASLGTDRDNAADIASRRFRRRKLVFIDGPEGVTIELSQWH
jgi:hypothetical protein